VETGAPAADVEPARASLEAPARAPVRDADASGLSALVIALSLAVALFLAASAALGLLGRSERGEWLLFVFAFGVALPGSLLAGWALWRSGRATWPRAGAAAAGSTVLLALGRALHEVEPSSRGLAALILPAGLGLCAAILLPVGAPRSGQGDAEALAARRFMLPLAVALCGLTLAFVPPGVLTVAPVVLATVAGAVAGLLHSRVRPPSLPRRVGPVLDVVVGAVVVLLVVDVVGYAGEGPTLSSGSGLAPEAVLGAVQPHLDFYLGPVNDMLHGRPLLVESAGQYGVLNLYLLAAWFKAAPLGYGPLGLLVGVLTAAQYLAAYWIQRLAGCGRLLAGAATLVAVAVTVLAAFGSPALFPSTGALRFGLPFALVLVVLLATRRGSSKAPASVAALTVIGLSALWSIETFVYVVAAYLSITAFDTAIRAGSLRQAGRLAGTYLARAGVAVVVAHVLFALGTRLLAGDWPDWGWYLEYFRKYSTGGLSQALARPWSPVWVIGAACFASLAAVATIAATNRAFALEKRVPLLAAAGISGAGAAFLSYFVGRSLDLLLPFVALPAFMLVAIWLALALDSRALTGRAKAAAVGVCSWLAILSFGLAWPQASDRWPRTALAHLPPGGRSTGDSVERVWDSPPIDPRSPAGTRLIRDYFPASGRALVIAEPDVAAEVVFRTGRTNLLPISIGSQEDFVFDRSARRVRDAVARLEAGTPMLLQRPAVTHLTEPPRFGPLSIIGGKRLSAVQLEALRAIESRFGLDPVAKGASGFEVLRLREKRRG
jgi:hypothetical protein